jgi:hypothetical protein
MGVAADAAADASRPRRAPASGIALFIRYAFMPNHLGYCGGNENVLLL